MAHLFFSDEPGDVDFAKRVCGGCGLRVECRAGALDRREPWGVWGGELFRDGQILSNAPRRGRPRRADAPAAAEAV